MPRSKAKVELLRLIRAVERAGYVVVMIKCATVTVAKARRPRKKVEAAPVERRLKRR